jgi:hypothetical protein
MIKVWQIDSGNLRALPKTTVDLEKEMEQWIEANPSLIQNGLKIVGRQLDLEGGRLDLLAFDPQGRWVVVEIKRGELRRETIAQAIDYASCIIALPREDLKAKIDAYLVPRNEDIEALLDQRNDKTSLDEDQREIKIIVVGTSESSGLQRMIQYLSGHYNMPISSIVFEIFEAKDGRRIMTRDLSALDDSPAVSENINKANIEDVFALSTDDNFKRVLAKFIGEADSLDLHVRPWKKCIMFTSKLNKVYTLFTVWINKKEDKIYAWVGNTIFSDYYDMQPEEVKNIIGEEGYHLFSLNELEEFLVKFSNFMKRLMAAKEIKDGEK